MSAITTRNPSPLSSFLDKIASTEQVQAVVSRHITTEKVVALMTSEAARSPQLAQAAETSIGRKSLVSFFMLATQLGLEPGAARGLLYPTPRRVKGQWTVLPVVGYKGYCELARRSKQIVRLNANVFYGEEIERGLVDVSYEPPMVEHRWHPDVEKRDEDIVGAYAIAKLTTTDEPVIVVLNRADIEKSRRLGAQNGPWKSHYAAMARKTAIRRLLTGGLVPLGAELAEAVSQDIVEEDQPIAHVHVDLDLMDDDDTAGAPMMTEPVAQVTTSTGEVIDLAEEDVAEPEPAPPPSIGKRMSAALPSMPTINDLPPATVIDVQAAVAETVPEETPAPAVAAPAPEPAVVMPTGNGSGALSRSALTKLKKECSDMEGKMTNQMVQTIRTKVGWSKSMRSRKTMEYHKALFDSLTPENIVAARTSPVRVQAGDWFVSNEGNTIRVLENSSRGVKYHTAGDPSVVRSSADPQQLHDATDGWQYFPVGQGADLPDPRVMSSLSDDTRDDMVNMLNPNGITNELSRLEPMIKNAFRKAARIEAGQPQHTLIRDMTDSSKSKLLKTLLRLAARPTAWQQ